MPLSFVLPFWTCDVEQLAVSSEYPVVCYVVHCRPLLFQWWVAVPMAVRRVARAARYQTTSAGPVAGSDGVPQFSGAVLAEEGGAEQSPEGAVVGVGPGVVEDGGGTMLVEDGSEGGVEVGGSVEPFVDAVGGRVDVVATDDVVDAVVVAATLVDVAAGSVVVVVPTIDVVVDVVVVDVDGAVLVVDVVASVVVVPFWTGVNLTL